MPPSPATGCARWLTRDVGLLLAARALRMLACGALSVVFALHLSGLGFSPGRIMKLQSRGQPCGFSSSSSYGTQS